MTSKRKGSSPADLSSEDKRLWQHVVRGAEPLTGRDRLRSRLDDLREQRRAAGAAGEKAPQTTPAKRTFVAGPLARPVEPRKKQPGPLVHGARDGLDRRKADRLRRGKLPIEATLDLHGLRQAEAHRRLEHFLADSQAAGKRCVMVVTGKGVHKSEGGVLRAAVPRWLNEQPNRARVLSFDYAQQKHGGTGALYILLRRRR